MSESYTPESGWGLLGDGLEVHTGWPAPAAVMAERDRGLLDLNTLHSCAPR
ncbi:MAG: hypothetical protein GKR94_11015 [Gammaproteobacteria bacterium]|nr:hypothetical protein [Gammaproteobacteria bacterium]